MPIEPFAERVFVLSVGASNDSYIVPFPLGLSVKITVCCLKISCFKLDLSLNFGRI